MITRVELTAYLHDLLSCADFEDYAPNGLQIEGGMQIHRICTAVTASMDAINKAIAFKSDALIVHHGYFWRGEDPVLIGMKRKRIAELLKYNINLFAYHLPLDCHAELGNNACLGRLFNLESIETHKIAKTRDLLWSGTLAETITAKQFAVKIQKILGREALHLSGSEKPIQKLAWCSGAAQDLIEHAHKLGVDGFLSGEVSERTFYQAQELGIHYFSSGHHATERYGVQALGKHLAAKYGLDYQFIDSTNPI
ncbi:MAG: Nif3-like dinuclear metal center hexameric protein [Tatlockia sp.]|nr:Nif3-like dinuclear metal center hexameric protein [Tatlockia sp.]